MPETIRTFIVTTSWNSLLTSWQVAWVASPLKFSGTIFQLQLRHLCFLCGPPPMVDSLETVLKELGYH